MLCEKALEISKGARLFMNTYSAPLFEGKNIVVDDLFELKAGAGDYCFCETKVPDLSVAEGVILFKWNRDYPADSYLEFDPKALGFKKQKDEDFEGSSHKKITMEVYGR